jgi:radical SAM protein with 4Fe4S-binding SPASM domain
MANVLLTEKCVRSCPYCFAKEHMENSESKNMTWDNIIYIADLFEISGEKRLSLLGGEPTLHEHFNEFVKYLIERNFHINIFTSGVISDFILEKMKRFLSDINPEQLSFVCNINHPSITSKNEAKQLDKFLLAFGQITTAGYNIYEPTFELDFLFDLITKYGLRKHVRIGLTHPIPGEINKYVKLEEMNIMAEKFCSYLPMFERYQVSPGFDCGMPLCLFSDELIGKLFKSHNGNLKFGCGPAIDIGTDMSVWSCFPLSGFNKKSIYEFNSVKEIADYFQSVHQRVRGEISGIYFKCDECYYREINLCHGGCLAHGVSKLQAEKQIRPKEMYL